MKDKTNRVSLSDRLTWLRSLAVRQSIGTQFVSSSLSLKRRLGRFEPRMLDVVDCGCGLSETPVSRQVTRLPFRRLVSVDAFPEIVALAKRVHCRAAVREVVCLSITALPQHYRYVKSFDVALCLDVLEHLQKPDALRFLADLESIVRSRIVLWLPLGEYRVDADPHSRGNPFELHRSFWSSDELDAAGYSTEVLPRFHHARFDALWAVKDLSA